MLNSRPGAYIRIGNGDEQGGCQVHNPGYDFNDDLLCLGATSLPSWPIESSRVGPAERS